jgi:hypothetical protein
MQGGRSGSAGWTCEAGHHLYKMRSQVGWPPSRFLADHAEVERAFQLAERLGGVNAAAQELGYHLAVAARERGWCRLS